MQAPGCRQADGGPPIGVRVWGCPKAWTGLMAILKAGVESAGRAASRQHMHSGEGVCVGVVGVMGVRFFSLHLYLPFWECAGKCVRKRASE